MQVLSCFESQFDLTAITSEFVVVFQLQQRKFVHQLPLANNSNNFFQTEYTRVRDGDMMMIR